MGMKEEGASRTDATASPAVRWRREHLCPTLRFLRRLDSCAILTATTSSLPMGMRCTPPRNAEGAAEIRGTSAAGPARRLHLLRNRRIHVLLLPCEAVATRPRVVLDGHAEAPCSHGIDEAHRDDLEGRSKRYEEVSSKRTHNTHIRTPDTVRRTRSCHSRQSTPSRQTNSAVHSVGPPETMLWLS